MSAPAKVIKRFQRYSGYDYSRGAAVFVTIVTSPRRRLFGEIVNARLVKTPLGEEVDEAVARIRRRVGDYVYVGGWISPGEKAVRDRCGKAVYWLPDGPKVIN